MKGTPKIFIAITFFISACLVLYVSCGKKSPEPAPCYNLTVETNGSGTIDIEPDSNCYHTGTEIILTAIAEEGWSFDNWSGDVTSENNPLTITISDANVSVNANFSQEEYTLSISIHPLNSGSVAKDPDQETYYYNDTVTLTATPDSGYMFDSWTGDITSNDNPVEIIILGNTSLTANFIEEGEPQSDTATISGTVTWPGHELSEYTYAFADTIEGQYIYLFAQTDVNPDDGSYTLIIPNIADSLQLFIEAQDDVNNNSPWLPDAGDGWGFLDVNENGTPDTDDYITVYPGDDTTGIDIILEEQPGLQKKSHILKFR